MDRTQELEDQVQSLSRALDEMRNRMARLEGGTSSHENGAARSNRRGFLRLGAAAAAGAFGWLAVKAVPAAAATGGNMLLGCANAAANQTTVQTTAAVSPAFGAEDMNFSPSLLASSLATFGETFSGPLQGLGGPGGSPGTEGIDGWASGTTAYGVYGFTDTGTGVTGESLSGIGLYARTTGRIRQDPFVTAGSGQKPTYLLGAAPNLYEQLRDQDGVLWIHDASGNWRRVNTLRTDAADGSANFFKPFRLIDTRSGAIKAPGSVTSIVVAPSGSGASSIPANAIAVTGNLTAAAYTGGGFLTIMPQGITVGTGAGQYNPASDPSSVNFIVGQGAIANSFICGLNPANGSLQVYVGGPPLPGHSSHFIVDITGYIQ
jgi:hypothetical protein